MLPYITAYSARIPFHGRLYYAAFFYPVFLSAMCFLLAGCLATRGFPGPGGGVIVVGDERGRGHRGPRALKIPPGHYPPPGECRLWFPGRPPGQQPPPVRCSRLYRRVPLGAFILYRDRAWDSRYDWRAYERRHPNAVPRVILRLMRTVQRS